MKQMHGTKWKQTDRLRTSPKITPLVITVPIKSHVPTFEI